MWSSYIIVSLISDPTESWTTILFLTKLPGTEIRPFYDSCVCISVCVRFHLYGNTIVFELLGTDIYLHSYMSSLDRN